MNFREMVKQTFTGKDNQTIDLGRIIWFKGALAFIALTVWHTWHTGSFDPTSYGMGFGAVLAAGGAALRMKETTEPS